MWVVMPNGRSHWGEGDLESRIGQGSDFQWVSQRHSHEAEWQGGKRRSEPGVSKMEKSRNWGRLGRSRHMPDGSKTRHRKQI